MLLDGHTGSPRRMKDHEVIIGTRHDATCAPKLAAVVGAIFTRHDFNVHENVAGYTGGNIVATFGQPRTQRHPWLIHRLTYRRTNHENLHVRGYREGGPPARLLTWWCSTIWTASIWCWT